MRRYFATGCCGMNPRTGSKMAGIYMIMVCFMQMIFNQGNLRDARQRLTEASFDIEHDWLLSLIPSLYYFVYFLLTINLCMCFFLLFCIYKHSYQGLLMYIAWIFIYETINTVLLTATEQHMELRNLHVRPIEWFGYGIRLALHCFWLTYVVSYALELANDMRKPLFDIRRLRRLSRNRPKIFMRQQPRVLPVIMQVMESPSKLTPDHLKHPSPSISISSF
uniref:Transmembrane protein 217-like n=1 Tax=Geotrypetes seraphini TaxID=260995 RepID=A0A6P8SCL5_GEOSA|nr:transmembrane protein 217-like [Geotrypetes seraphini]XP_033816386.1 transmembrane protein 217-like [Geotrypetes seraphini]XP_033816387.1 transmembrane protein 217-like [Geotrypetes seraphini]XP_033816388.1 transmembrane protein 217-like [Geotrypetes seraphini]